MKIAVAVPVVVTSEQGSGCEAGRAARPALLLTAAGGACCLGHRGSDQSLPFSLLLAWLPTLISKENITETYTESSLLSKDSHPSPTAVPTEPSNHFLACEICMEIISCLLFQIDQQDSKPLIINRLVSVM